MNLQAMTREKLQFLLPVVFTVGPDVNQRGGNAVLVDRTHHDADVRQEHVPIVDRGDALMKYAMLLADGQNNKNVATRGQHIENIVKGIIEGETRVLVSSMVCPDPSTVAIQMLIPCIDDGRDLYRKGAVQEENFSQHPKRTRSIRP
jgi:hypothetical protein